MSRRGLIDIYPTLPGSTEEIWAIHVCEDLTNSKTLQSILNLISNLLDFSTMAAEYSAHVTPPRVTSQTQVLLTTSMRLVAALKFLFLLLLAVLLFGSEVGESACLVDDVSNDYILAPASPVHQLVQRAPAHVIFQGSLRSRTN